MARLVNTEATSQLCVTLSTIFENGKQTDRTYKIGDIIENLRYVEDNQVKVVSGRLKAINYSMNSKLSFNKASPSNTFAKDITLKSLDLDTSVAYQSSDVSVPINEIVEWDYEKNVSRMKYAPSVIYTLKMTYTDGTVNNVTIRIGGVYEAHIINPTALTDITKQYTVTAFGYKTVASKYQITSIVFEDANGTATVADIENILYLNDLYISESKNASSLADAIHTSIAGDTLLLGNDIDCSGAPLQVMDKEDITINTSEYTIKVQNSESSRIKVAESTLTFVGNGTIISTHPYDEDHGYATLEVQDNAHVIFNGSGVYSVIENDPKKYGQFGISVKGNGQLTINEGTFNSGFYCVAGNAVSTNKDAIVTINGGELTSINDYAVFQCYDGKLIINDGKINGGTAGIGLFGGYCQINGGTIIGNGEKNNKYAANGVLNGAINIHPLYADVNLIITGGIFMSSHSEAITITPTAEYDYKIKINGGYFSSKPKPEWIMEGFTVSEEPNSSGLYYIYAI